MFLESLDSNNDKMLKKINKFLKESYGFTLSENSDVNKLCKIHKKMKDKIEDLTLKENFHKDPTYSKAIMVMKGIEAILEKRKEQLEEVRSDFMNSGTYRKTIERLTNQAIDSMEIGDSFEEAIEDAMKEYRSSIYRFPDYYVEWDLKKRVSRHFEDKGEYVMENNPGDKRMKRRSKVLETDIDEAEVLLAARGFSQEIQEMIEKFGRLQNEDLGPIADKMRDLYGADLANTFSERVYEELDSVLEHLRSSRQNIDEIVYNIEQGRGPETETDMDMEPDFDSEEDDEFGDLEVDEPEEEPEDDFGGEEIGPEEEPLGRAPRSESKRQKAKRLEERLKRLSKQIRSIKESKKKTVKG